LSLRTYFKPVPLLAIFLACSVSSIRAAEIASATISSTQLNPTTWQYDVVLDDIGTTDIGTLWLGWVPGEDFMPTDPFDVMSPTSWTDIVTNAGAGDGFAIQWVAGSGAALTPGDSLAGFQFDSATTPTQMAANSPFYPSTPVLTSFVYSGAPFSDAGSEFVVQAASSSTPEPASFMLIVCGGMFVLWLRRQAGVQGRSTPESR
jgi:hypothetical protein